MKAKDFKLPSEIKYDFDTGITTFRHSRIVIMDAAALGLLRQSLYEELGHEKTRSFFLKLGYSNGYADFMQMKKKYESEFDSETELLASGPVIHTWEGIVKAIPTEIRIDRESGEFFFTGRWINSYEAEQFLSFNEPSNEPVCWSVSGYASGWCSAFFGSPLLAMEPKCVGRGDDECGWLIQPPGKFGDEAASHIEALQELWGE